MKSSSIRVLVADDQDTVRRGLRRLIDGQPDMSVVGEAGDGWTAVELARSLRPDVALVDIRMPELDGLEVTRLLAGPTVAVPVRVVVVTTFDHDDYVYAALRGGACGFLLKRSGPALLAEAVRAAVAGESLISPAITVRLLRHLAAPSAPAGRLMPNVLSPRETEVARLIARGRSNLDIANELFISVGTVKTHVANIQTKLGTVNRVGIAAWAWETGLMQS
ncbi:response regulator transcription factor [Micromonospora sp. KC723]|uniref:response regulator n=1 Tax=Micromonospora sp. KC723 TaxID=2530381 RepID=UPI00105037B0|nr:response regulator transcription factor [Micromonospora sp. KC723]TDB69657.1 response regulator transcription factor [Micromonospora sp. KC723]